MCTPPYSISIQISCPCTRNSSTPSSFMGPARPWETPSRSGPPAPPLGSSRQVRRGLAILQAFVQVVLHHVAKTLSQCMRAGSRLPTRLSAVKSSVGHTEAAAGLLSLTAAAAALLQASCPPLRTLRALNPYVAANMEGGLFSAARGPSPLVAGSAGATAGASSFAFQVGSCDGLGLGLCIS